jgi:hypothetical protein
MPKNAHLAAGAANLALVGLSARDGLRVAGRLRSSPPTAAKAR